jgi:hypothetical protein
MHAAAALQHRSQDHAVPLPVKVADHAPGVIAEQTHQTPPSAPAVAASVDINASVATQAPKTVFKPEPPVAPVAVVAPSARIATIKHTKPEQPTATKPALAAASTPAVTPRHIKTEPPAPLVAPPATSHPQAFVLARQ